MSSIVDGECQRKKGRKTAKAPRQVNNAVTSPSEHEEDVNDDHPNDLELQVYAARRQRSARLSSEHGNLFPQINRRHGISYPWNIRQLS